MNNLLSKTGKILVEPRIDSIVMPDNLKVGLMVAEQRKKCTANGCHEEYYGLGFGQSPFHVPRPIADALSQNVDKGHYSAAEGVKELREAISGFNKRHFGLNVDPDRIIVGPGTKDLIHTIVSIIQGGVILPSPSWIGYKPQVSLLDKHFHLLKLKREFGYKIQPKDLQKIVQEIGGKQHILVLNNPHNPTGAVYLKSELEALAQVCRQNNILVLSDEIYALDTYNMDDFTSMGLVYPEGTFVTNGISKDRSAGGYRLGSVILPTTSSKKLKDDFQKVAATVYTNVSTPIQYATINAYEPNKEIEDYIQTTRKIHRIMGNYLSNEWDSVEGIHASKPEGAFYFFADFNDLSQNLQRHGVDTSNKLGESLLSCPFHLATVTGDANLLEPKDYGARIAFVDYDGKKTFENFKNDPPKTASEEVEFVKENAPMMTKSVDSLKEWVKNIKA